MTSRDVNSKHAAPDQTWLAATSLSDPNAALWNSLRPTGRLSWLASLRQHVESLSPLNPLRQLLPSSLQSGSVPPRWLVVGALVLCAGAGLSVFGRVAAPPADDAASGVALRAAESGAASAAAAAGALSESGSGVRVGATEVAVTGWGAPRTVAPVVAEATVIHSLSPSELPLAPSDPEAKASSAKKKKARALAKRRAAKSRRSSAAAATLP